jgi:hypothetical protein
VVDVFFPELPLSAGDWCLLYTDGIPETINPAGIEFGTDYFKQSLGTEQSTSADHFAERLLEELSHWSARGPTDNLNDDITIGAIHAKVIKAMLKRRPPAIVYRRIGGLELSVAEPAGQDEIRSAQRGRR